MDEEEQEKNVVLIFQIPLVVKNVRRNITPSLCQEKALCSVQRMGKSKNEKTKSLGMDEGILKKGEGHSNFKGVDNKTIERDSNLPIRCTVQFYKVTDTQEVPEGTFKEMYTKIETVYKYGVARGSLVTEGYTGRSTEPINEIK